MVPKGNRRGLKAKAVAYIRTSSTANVGTDKDSEKRQRDAITAYTKRSGLEIVGEFNDAAVSGADHIETRPGFTAMLAYIASNGARTIIVETASRFARDLMVQEVGFAKLQALGVKLVAADSPQSFLDDTPTSKLIRQILGAVSEFDKAMVVAKLKGARERKRTITGKKVEGRKSHAELRPELVALVRQLRRRRPKGGQRSLRDISAELSQRGIMNERGQPFSAASINSMLRLRSTHADPDGRVGGKLGCHDRNIQFPCETPRGGGSFGFPKISLAPAPKTWPKIVSET